MKNTFKMLIGFCVGGVIGGGITYFLLKKKFDARIDAEVQSVKELYSNKEKEQKKSECATNSADIKNTGAEAANNAEKSVENNFKATKKATQAQDKKLPVDYVNFYSNSKQGDSSVKENGNVQKVAATTEKKPPKKSIPVVISPDEFESEKDYITIYLTYYADGVLADEMDNPVKIDSTIGKDALKHFGEYEDDLLHVRSDKGKIYYEVAKDNRKYSDGSGNDTDGDEED